MKTFTKVNQFLSSVGEGAGRTGADGAPRIALPFAPWISWTRALACVLGAIVAFDGVAAPLAHSHELETLWQSRRQAAADKSSLLSSMQLAALLPALAPTSFESISRFPDVHDPARQSIPSYTKTILGAISRNTAKINRVSLANRLTAPLVVLFQDVHLNTEAQTNMAKTLERLVALPEKPLVAVEGAEGRFDLTLLRAFRDEPLKRAIADAALEKNILSAPSYIGLTSTTPLDLIGVDDVAHYDANEDALRDAQKLKPAMLKEIQTDRADLEADKNRLLSVSQKELDRLLRSREQNTDTLANHVRALEQMLPGTQNELVVEQFLAACRLEKDIDFAQADREKQAALQKLAGQISASEKTELIRSNSAYQAGARSFAEHLNAIRLLFERHHLDLRRTPQFSGYLQYVLLSDRLDAEQLLIAVKKMEQQARTRWVDGEAQKQLFERSRALYLREKLVRLALTPDEWAEYKALVHSPWTRDHGQNLAPFERFYGEADIRSEKMVKNVLGRGIHSLSFVVLVVGGFHTPRITRLLQERGISTAVVQPLITHIDNGGESTYLSVFTRDKTPIEKLLDGEKLFLAPPQPLVGRPDSLANANLMRVAAPMALADTNSPLPARVKKVSRGPRTWNVALDGVGNLTVATSDLIPPKYREIQRDAWPSIGTLRYLAASKPVSESPWLTIPVLGMYAVFQFCSVPFAWPLAVAINAIIFVAIHDNRTGGRFDGKRFVARALGAAAIIALATIIFDPRVSLLRLIMFVLATIGFHAMWNRVMPDSLQLQITPPHIRVRAGQDAQLELVKSELRQIAKRGGLDKPNIDEQNALRLYLLRKHNVVARAPLPHLDMSPRLITAIQNHEYMEFAAHPSTPETNQHLEDRLRFALSLYSKIPAEADRDETVLAWLADAADNRVPRPTYLMTLYQLRLPTGARMRVPRLVTSRQLSDDVFRAFHKSTAVKTPRVKILLARLESIAALKRASPDDLLLSHLRKNLKTEWDAAITAVFKETEFRRFVLLRRDMLRVIKRLDEERLWDELGLLPGHGPLLLEQLREKWERLSEKDRLGAYRAAITATLGTPDRLPAALTQVLNTVVVDSTGHAIPGALKSVIDRLTHALSSPRNTPFWQSKVGLKSLAENVLLQAQMLYSFVRGPTSPIVISPSQPPNPPAAAAVATAAPSPSPSKKTGLRRETLQRIAFYTVYLIAWLVSAKWTWVVSFLQWTDLAYFANSGVALASTDPHLSFTNVTAALAVIEFVYRLMYVIARTASSWLAGTPANVRFSTLTTAEYKGEPDTLLRVERFDGVEVDFTSNKAELIKAIKNRFFRYVVDASKPAEDKKLDNVAINLSLSELNTKQLRRLYFLLDKKDGQRQEEADINKTLVLLRDLFFKTQIARWRYGVSGRFENHHAITVDTAYREDLGNKAKAELDPAKKAEHEKEMADYDAWTKVAVEHALIQAEQIINDAIKAVKNHSGMRLWESVVRWSVTNNIVTVGFVAFLLRLIPIIIMGTIGGLFLSAIGFDTLFYFSLEDVFKQRLFPEFGTLKNLNDLLESQNLWQRGIAATREFLTPVAQQLHFTPKAVISSMFIALGLDVWQIFKRMRRGSLKHFWSTRAHLKKTVSVWFLGGQIALAAAVAGAAGHTLGGKEGDTIFRGAVNLLEGERDSAISLIQDLQNGALGYVGWVTPQHPNIRGDAASGDAGLSIPAWKIGARDNDPKQPVKPDDSADERHPQPDAARFDPLKPFVDDLDRSIESLAGGFSLRRAAGNRTGHLYDMAMAAQTAMSENKLDDAVSLLTRPWPTRSDVRVRGPSGLRSITAPVSGADADTRIGDGAEWKVDTGAILHDGLSALTIMKQLPNDRRAGPEGRALTGKVEQTAIYAMAVRTKDGGFHQGPLGKPGDPKDQRFKFNRDAPRLYDNFATEHQWDAYAFFSEMARQTGDAAYQRIADDALGFAIQHNWDPVAHRFRAGFLDINGRIQPSSLYPTDTQAWAISLVGVEKLISFILPGEAAPRISSADIAAMLRALDREHSVRNGAGVVLGYDYLANRQTSGVPGPPIVSIEWTAQVLAAKLQVAKYLKANPTQREKFGLDPTALESEVRSVAEMLAQFKRGPHGGLYYAHHADGSPAEGIPTGFGWDTQTGESLISAVYLRAVLNGFDPVSPNAKELVFPGANVASVEKNVKAEKKIAEAVNAKPLDGIGDIVWVAQKNWAWRATEARQRAEEAANTKNQVVEIPTIPVDRNGIPIKLVDRSGKELDAREEDPRRIFLAMKNGLPAAAGKPTLSLAEAMQPGSPYFDSLRRRFISPPGAAFTPLLDAASAIMRDLSGRVIPKEGFFVHPFKDVHNPLGARWKDSDGNITASFPKGKIAAPIDPDTKNDILLGVDKARAENMTDAQIDNFAALTERRINERDAVALIVDKNFKVTGTLTSLEQDQTGRLRSYMFGPMKNGEATLEDYDPLIYPTRIPDVVKMPNGERVFFTLKAEEAKIKQARLNAERALVAARAAWGQKVWGNDIPDLPIMTVIQIKNQAGDIVQTLTVGDSRELEAVAQQLGIKDLDKSFLLNTALEFPMDPGRHVAVPYDNPATTDLDESKQQIIFTRFDHPDFPDLWMGLVKREIAVHDRGHGRVAIKLKPGLVEEEPVDADAFEHSLNRNQREQWRTSLALQMPDGSTVARRWLAYFENDNGEPTQVFDDPLQVYRLLRNPDLLYEIPVGLNKLNTQRVPFHLLPENPTVLAIYEPDNKNRIVLGSAWTELQAGLNANARAQLMQASNNNPVRRAIEMRLAVVSPPDQCTFHEIVNLESKKNRESFDEAFERVKRTSPSTDQFISARFSPFTLAQNATDNNITVEEMIARELRSTQYEGGLVPYVTDNVDFHKDAWNNYLNRLRNQIRNAARARNTALEHQLKMHFREAVESQSYIPSGPTMPVFTYIGHEKRAKQLGMETHTVFEYRWVFLGNVMRVFLTPDAKELREQLNKDRRETARDNQIEEARLQDGGVLITNAQTKETRMIPFSRPGDAERAAAEQAAYYKKLRGANLTRKLELEIKAGTYQRPNGDAAQIIASWSRAQRYADDLAARFKPAEARRHMEDFLGRIRVDTARRSGATAVVAQTDPSGRVTVITDPAEVEKHIHALEALKFEKERAYQKEKDPAAQARLAQEIQRLEWHVYVKGDLTFVIENFPVRQKELHDLFLDRVQRTHQKGGDNLHRTTLFDQNNHAWGMLETDDSGDGHGTFYKTTVASAVRFDPVNNMTLIERRTYGRATPPTKNERGTLLFVQQDWVDSKERSASHISGHVEKDGTFIPLFITNDTFSPDKNAIDDVTGSQTHPISDPSKLRRSDYNRDVAPLLDPSHLIGKPKDVALGTDWMDLFGDVSATGRKKIRGVIEPLKAKADRVIEVNGANGSIYRSLLDQTGRVLAIFEGTPVKGAVGFKPLRLIVNHYDAPALAAFQVASSSTLYNVESGAQIGDSKTLSTFDEYLRSGEIVYEITDNITRVRSREVKNTHGERVRTLFLKLVVGKDGKEDYVPFNLTLPLYSYGADQHGAWGLSDHDFTFVTNEHGEVIDPETGAPLDLKDRATLLDKLAKNKLPYFEATRIVMRIGEGRNVRVIYETVMHFDDARHTTAVTSRRVKDHDGNLIENQLGFEDSAGNFSPSRITLNALHEGPGDFGRFKITDMSKTFTARFFPAHATQQPFILNRLSVGEDAVVQIFGVDGKLATAFSLEAAAKQPLDLLSPLLNMDVSRVRILNRRGETLVELLADETSWLPTQQAIKDKIAATGFPEVPPPVDKQGRLHYYREKYALDSQGRRIVQQQFLDYVAEREWRHSFNLVDKSYGQLTYDDKRRAQHGSLTDQDQHPSVLNPTPHGGSLKEETWQRTVSVRKNPYLPDLPEQIWQVDDVKKTNTHKPGQQWINVAGKKAVETTPRYGDDGQEHTAVTTHVSDQDAVPFQVHSLSPGKNSLPVQFAVETNADGTVDLHDSDFVYLHVEAAADSLGQHLPWVMVLKDKNDKSIRVGAKELIPFWNTGNPDKKLSLNDEKTGRSLAPVALQSESAVIGKGFILAVPVQQLASVDKFDLKSVNPSVTLETERGPDGPPHVRVSSILRAARPSDQRSPAETLKPQRQLDTLTLEQFRIDSTLNNQSAVYDGESNEDGIIDIPIRDAGGRLLARMNILVYPDDRNGRPREKRVLILFDAGAQPHPLGMVELPVDATVPALDFEKLTVRPYAISKQDKIITVYETNPLLPSSVPVVRTYNPGGLYPERPVQTSIGEGLDLEDTDSDIARTAQGINNDIFAQSWGWLKSLLPGASPRRANPVSPVSRADLRAAFDRLDKGLLTRINERLQQEYAKLPANKRPAALQSGATTVSPMEVAKGAAVLGIFTTVGVGILGLALTLSQWVRRKTKKLTAIRPVVLLSVTAPLILLGLLPLFTPVYDYFWSRWFKKNKKVADDPTSPPMSLSDEALRVEAMTRYAERVQGRLVRDKDLNVLDMTKPADQKKVLLITGDEDIEGGFIQSAIDIYVTCYAGLIRWRDADPMRRAPAVENKLRNLDGFVRAINKAMAREWGRGNELGRYKAMAPYHDPNSKVKIGTYYPQVWNELNKLLSIYHARLKTALVKYDASEFNIEFKRMFMELIKHDTDEKTGRLELLLDDDTAEQVHPIHPDVIRLPKYIFNMDVLRSAAKEKEWRGVPALSIIVARHLLLRLVPVFVWSLLMYGGSFSTSAAALNPVWIAVVIILGLLSFTMGALTESPAILNGRSPSPPWPWRTLPAFATLSALTFLFFFGSLAFTGMAAVGFFIVVFMAEFLSLLQPRFFSFGDHRSLFGVAAWIVLRPPAHMAPPRHYLLSAISEAAFLAAAVMLTTSIFLPWAAAHYAMLEYGKMIGAALHFIIMLPLLHKALNYHVRMMFTAYDLLENSEYSWISWIARMFRKVFNISMPQDPPAAGPDDKAKRKKLAISFVSTNTIRSQIFHRNGDRKTVIDDYKKALQFRLSYASSREAFLMLIRAAATDSRLNNAEHRSFNGSDAEIENVFMEWLELLWKEEERSKKTFFSPQQLWDERMPDDLRFGKDLSEEDKVRLEHLHHLMRALHETSGMILLNNSSIDVAYNLCDLAISARRRGHADKTIFYLVNNVSLRPEQSAHDPHYEEDYSKTGELQQRMYLAELLKYLSSDDKGENGAEAYVMKVHTAQGTKAGALNGPMLLPESFKNVGQSIIVDVNSTALDLDHFWEDQELMWDNPDVMAIVAQRNVPGRENAILDSEYVAEGGHYMSMRSGGSKEGAPITGTGWGNTVRVQFWDNLSHQANSHARIVNADPQSGSPPHLIDQLFGLSAMPYQFPGISEDYWQVAALVRDYVGQSAQGGGTGKRPQVRLSRTLWFRARAAGGDLFNLGSDKPRWVGGYFATMNDAAIQQAVEFGPYSLATRELRMTEGDGWSLLLATIAYIFCMPWSVTLDFSPFIGTKIGLFFTGGLFNQASTGNAFLLNCRDRGFFSGNGDFLATRIPGMWIWSYRENRNMLSAVTGFNDPSSAFDASKPENAPNPIKVILENWHDTSLLRVVGKITAVLWQGRGLVFTKDFWQGRKKVALAPHSFFNSWMVGWVLLLSTLIAIRGQNGDSLIMMILFLWYAVGGVAGPMVKARKKGHVVGRHGWGDILAKWIGFAAAYGFLLALTWVGSHAAFMGSFRLTLVLGAAILLLSETYPIFQQLIENADKAKWFKLERLLSEGGRSFATLVMMVGLLYFAPVPSVINLGRWDGEPWFMERSVLAQYFRWAVIGVFVLITIGKLMDVRQTSRLGKRYGELRDDLLKKELAMSPRRWELTSPIYSLLLEGFLNINRMAWRRARQSLDRAENLLRALPTLENQGLNDFGKKPEHHSNAPADKPMSRLDWLFWHRREQRLAVESAA